MSDDNDRALLPFDMGDGGAGRLIRRKWHDGRWFFSVVDVVALLTDSDAPQQYWRDMKRRIQDEGFRDALSLCRPLKVPASDGKSRETDCADFATMMSLLFALPAWRRSARGGLHDSAHQDTCDSGIYAITNLLTEEQYIGSSGNISARFQQHKALLRQGKHHARLLQDAWNRYGAESFQFEILEDVSVSQHLESIEQQYLIEYQPAYNSAPVALNSAAKPPIAARRFRTVLTDLYAISGFGKSAMIFRTTRDAIVTGVLRPGPNFQLLLQAENDAVQSCEALSAVLQRG